jgi:Kef-type K+ transport system membrane component KefB/mannitol/fructose-specific phosphotransferase system IIA component (Ntr-type)
MHLTSEQIAIFFLSVGIMLFSARLFGELFLRLKFAPIIGEILAGIILGPTVLGTVFPSGYEWLFPADNVKIALDGIINISIILLLLITGIEVDLSIVISQRKIAFFTSLMGILIPFLLGFGFAYMFPDLMGIKTEDMRLVFALFMGTALSISSLPVIAKTLMDLNLFKTKSGMIIISSAMINDVIGWLIFSVILGMMGSREIGYELWEVILFLTIFIFLAFLPGRRILNYLINLIQDKISFPSGILNFILIIGFFAAAFTEHIGVHGIIGAFILGIAIGDSGALKEETNRIIQQFILNIFAPLFFVSIGLRINFITNFDIIIILIVIVLATAGKLLGSGIGAYLSGSSKSEALTIAFGLNARGTMEIILGLLALQAGLIHQVVFVALVVMALFTSLLSAPMIKYFLKGKIKLTFSQLIQPDIILFSDAETKVDLIKDLVAAAGRKIKIDEQYIISDILNREESNPTGIANYLAIPHTRAKIKRPIAIIAKHSPGLNFESSDKLPSKIIVLLLIPENENETQLQLLSEIVRKFVDPVRVEELLLTRNKEDFINKLRLL